MPDTVEAFIGFSIEIAILVQDIPYRFCDGPVALMIACPNKHVPREIEVFFQGAELLGVFINELLRSRIELFGSADDLYAMLVRAGRE